VNHGEEDRSSLGIVMEDLKMEVRNVKQWRMSFVKRDRNHIAHVLAKYAIRSACYGENVGQSTILY
jgi:hypothetical protein